MKFKEIGILKFMEQDVYVAHVDLYPVALEFVRAVVKEADCGYTEQTIQELSKLVSYGYMVHRYSTPPWDLESMGWWAAVDKPGRGHVKVWAINLASEEAISACMGNKI